jgi:hypothetical protein
LFVANDCGWFQRFGVLLIAGLHRTESLFAISRNAIFNQDFIGGLNVSSLRFFSLFLFKISMPDLAMEILSVLSERQISLPLTRNRA